MIQIKNGEINLRQKKFYSVREWKKFYKNQELMCKKYDIILTDYKTKKEKIISSLKQINLKNIDKGISAFNKIIQEFGGSMDQLTRDINDTKNNKSRVRLWSNSPKIYSQTNDKENLERIWGKK